MARKKIDPNEIVEQVTINRDRFKNGIERRMTRIYNQIKTTLCDEQSEENDDYLHQLVSSYDQLSAFYKNSGFDLTRFENELKGWERP